MDNQYDPNNVVMMIGDDVIETQDNDLEVSFSINDDGTADWAIERIADSYNERDRLITLAKAKIEVLKRQIDQITDAAEHDIAYLRQKLEDYFYTVPHRTTPKGTQETYKLLRGTLKLVRGGQEFDHDDDELVPWLRENGLGDYIKEEARWGDLKKQLSFIEGKAVTAGGEIVPGVTVSQKPDTFNVEIKK
jgi:phage host-nuclease inhibitor protein Gam